MDVRIDLLPKQRLFVESRDLYPAYIGGYGAGKTYAGAVKALLHMMSINPGLPGLVVAPTYRELRDYIVPTFKKILDAAGIPWHLHQTHYDLTLPWWGSVAMLRSADDPESLKGPNVAWGWPDEVARQAPSTWGIMVSRVREPRSNLRQIFPTGTPEGLNWVYERWVESRLDGYTLFTASTEENIYVGEEYVKALESALDEDEVQSKLHGLFTEGAKGRIYKPFDRRTHLTDKNPFDPLGAAGLVKNLPVFLACDFNVDPCCWVYGQSHQGIVYVAGEIVLKDTDSQEMAAEAWSRLNGYQVTVYGDPAGKSRSTAGKSDYEILRMGGFPRQNVSSAAPAVKDRVNAVNRLMRLEKRKDGKERPRLYVHPSCKVLIRDLERVKWKENSGIIDKSDGDLTHASDALGYYVHQEFPLKPPMPGKTKVAEALSRNTRYGRR